MSAWAVLARVGLSLLAAGCAWGIVREDGNAAYSFALIGVMCAAYVRAVPHPPGLGALVVGVGLFNAAGFGWELYTRLRFYDELAHAVTPFVLALAGGTLFLAHARRPHGRRVVFFLVLSAGIAAGAAWEIVEWVTSKIWSGYSTEGVDDTVTDMMLDSLGAALAAVFVASRAGGVEDEARGIDGRVGQRSRDPSRRSITRSPA